ncbi:MAG: hypothetical protein COA79_06935 [Planctomycetota bacterium]|nr:MAG: hypothetical protein COA79_06935 [Planctomycetota bacterium]
MFDISDFIKSVEGIIASHQLGTIGAYQRWKTQSPENNREMGIDPYGCADAANILYTIGRFPSDQEERVEWIKTLQSLQESKTGLFSESTHHEIHTTAHCIAALELFDALPRHPLTALSQYKTPEKMEAFLDQLDWKEKPWQESHRGAGLYASLVLSQEVSFEWEDRYFNWLYKNTDPATGFLRLDCITQSCNEHDIFPHLAGSFHYLFNQQYARRPLPYPDAMVNSCLEIIHSNCFPLGTSIGFAEIDWVFCLTRSVRQSGHRHKEAISALMEFMENYIPFLLKLDPLNNDGLNDLHALFGTMCCLAELQTALPGQLKTKRPLHLVLDRRPFI